MHDNRPMLLKHIDRILDERVRPAIAETLHPLTVAAWALTNTSGPVAAIEGAGDPIPTHLGLAEDAPYQPFPLPHQWGPAWGTTWFRLDVDIPTDARHDHLELDIDLGWADHSPGFQCEGSVRTPDGTVLKALNPRNRWVPVREPDIDATGHLRLFVEAASNPLLLDVHPFLPTADGSRATQSHVPLYTFRSATLVRIHDDVRALAADLDTLLGLARTLPDDSTRAWSILLTTSNAIDQLDLADISGTAAHVRSLLAPLLAVPAYPDAPTLGAIGHAHIDSAWLWPVREARRKAGRTLSNVVRLLDDGSPMIFALPAAQHVAWVQQDDPALFARVKEYVASGQIVPVGGSWIEPDAMLPSGESLARQLTEGTAFFQRELGAQCHEIWLPDSFGYSGCLPQIAHLAGYDNFLTQKISWNQVDTFPHHTLWWEGIDGTRIFTHFPPADTYGAEVSAEQLAHAQSNNKDKGRMNTQMFLYGYGDGGGGPVREMVERIERAKNLAGAPAMEHMSSQEFFTRARADYPDAPVWVGELYLEKHRGTLTSQAKTKRGNREAEAALREAETWCTTAWVRGLLVDDAYPADLLHELWRTTLLRQFHDILPGSSIAWVYEDAEVALAQVIVTARTLAAQAQAALASGVPAMLLHDVVPPAPRGQMPQVPDSDMTTMDGRESSEPLAGTMMTVPMATGTESTAVVSTATAACIAGTASAASTGDAHLVFNTAPVARRLCGVDIPALGCAVVPARGTTHSGNDDAARATAHRTDAGAVLESAGTRVTLNAEGAITSLVLTSSEGERQEIVPPGCTLGVLQMANDFPNEWDAWDLDPFYRSSIRDLPGTLGEVDVVDGAPQAIVDVAFGASHARLTWRINPDTAVLEVSVAASWHETEKVLKLAFPVDVHATDAAYGAQFGHLRRPTHENTSWDAYRFEVCAHKWLHVGESGRGVGIVNDATYGWDVTRHARTGGGTWSLVRATLLRSARFPDPDQDQGEQFFRFGILAASQPGPVRDEAYRLDLPIRNLPVSALGSDDVVAALPRRLTPLISVTGAVVESIHAADDDSGDVLVRLYEPDGRRTRVTLRAPELSGAVGADLHGMPSASLGVEVSAAPSEEGEWTFELHPFGIATIRLRSARSH